MIAFWKTLNFLMAIFFAAGVAIQYGNPISIPGMAIYGAAGLACVLAIRDTNLESLPPMVGSIALAWALTLAPQVLGNVSLREIFTVSSCATVIEDDSFYAGRRMVGLLIVVFWMAGVSAVFWRQERQKSNG